MTNHDPKPPGSPPARDPDPNPVRDPDPGSVRDPVRDPIRDPVEPLRAPPVEPVRARASSAIYLVGGVTLALLLVAGLLFFNPAEGPGERTDQASQPERITITPTTPAPAAPPTAPTQRAPAQRP